MQVIVGATPRRHRYQLGTSERASLYATCGGVLNSSASADMFCSSQSPKDADSTIGSRRRRSVGDGSHWQWVHMHASTYARSDMCERRDAHVQVLFLQACVGQHDMRISAFMFGSSAIVRHPS